MNITHFLQQIATASLLNRKSTRRSHVVSRWDLFTSFLYDKRYDWKKYNQPTNQPQIGKEISAVGLISSIKSWELFRPEKIVVKLQSACFEKLIFLHVLNIRKTKQTANFEGLEPRCCEDKKAILGSQKGFGTFEKKSFVKLRPSFMCCKGNKNWNNFKVSFFEMPSPWRYKEN